MKYKLFFAFAIPMVLLLSCNSNDSEKKASPAVENADTVFESSPAAVGDSTLYVKNESLLWQVDDTKGFKLEKPKASGIDTMSAKNVIQLINNDNDSIHLDYLKTSHDTVYIHIPRSEMLTERIGSTGAEIYMASATYSLTELKGIKYVNYDFKEGDHASPGVYSRDDFKRFR